MSTRYEKRVQFHPKSVNYSVPATEFLSRFLIYHTKVIGCIGRDWWGRKTQRETERERETERVSERERNYM